MCLIECVCVYVGGGFWYLTSETEKSFPGSACASVCSYEGYSTLNLSGMTQLC